MTKLSKVDGSRVDERIIEGIEELLEIAKEGRVISFAGAVVLSDATTGNIVYGDLYPISLLGELSVLQRDLIDNHIELRNPVGGGES